MEVGKEAYLKQDDRTRSILAGMHALVVERSNGLDGFLKVHFLGTPVAIRAQKEHESLEEARGRLLRASASKGCILKILGRTTDEQPPANYSEAGVIDDNFLMEVCLDVLL